jgi:acyl carrier protein
MSDMANLSLDIKHMIVDNLLLQISPETIADEQPLFGPGGLGLDSVDALQLVVGLDKKYGLKIADPDVARKVLRSVTTIRAALEIHLAGR